MTEYASNSHKSKENNIVEPAKRVEKVISGTAKIKKKSELRKFADVFLQEDINTVKEYILTDVVVPAVRTLISDICKNGIDAFLYGKNGINTNANRSNAGRISYRQFYNQDNNRQPNVENHTKPSFNYNDIIIESRGEAEEVLVRMDEIMATYGLVRLADFYDLVDISCDYTANDYGWTDIRSARIIRTRDGYMIKLPKAVPLD